MFRTLRTTVVALTCLGMTACGGGSISPPKPATTVVTNPTSSTRHIKTIRCPQSSGQTCPEPIRGQIGPCTPDAAGFCLFQTGHTDTRESCVDNNDVIQKYSFHNTTYELYWYSSDQGTYNYGNTTDNNCPPLDAWDPGDPRTVTGDSSLP